MVAEDIATDALVRFWQRQRQDENSTSIALLLTILRNLCLDWLKHEAIRQKANAHLALWQKEELEFRISSLESCDPDVIFLKKFMPSLTAPLQKCLQPPDKSIT